MTRAQTQQTLRQLPLKWALALLALIVVYAFAQPALNSRLGWNLPSLARLLGEPEPKKKAEDDEPKTTASKPRKSRAVEEDSAEVVDQPPLEADESAGSGSLVSTQEPPEPSGKTSTKNTSTKEKSSKSPSGNKSKSGTDAKSVAKPTAPKPEQAKTEQAKTDPTLLYGILKEVGRDRYVSIEGLQYNPGSEEGHRLKHLERHLKDIPNRPGKHGVFDGEMKDALKWIDDAYARGKQGSAGVRKTQEDNRTIYEVTFSQQIGYIGGQDGRRSGNPPAKRLRLVVEGTKFVTAFPF